MQAKHVMTRTLKTIHPEASVLEAVGAMDGHIGPSLLVSDGDQLCGVLTRSGLRRGALEADPPSKTPASEFMDRKLERCYEDLSVDELRTMLRDDRIEHVLVYSRDRRLVGLVSSDFVS